VLLQMSNYGEYCNNFTTSISKDNEKRETIVGKYDDSHDDVHGCADRRYEQVSD
jgi:hypothetical protein